MSEEQTKKKSASKPAEVVIPVMSDEQIAKYKAEARAKILEEIGVTEDQLAAKATKIKKKFAMWQYDLGNMVVKINGQAYSGKGQATEDVCEVLMELANKKRTRLLNELYSSNKQIQQVMGGVSARVLSKEKVL